jgi:hypothetical protein
MDAFTGQIPLNGMLFDSGLADQLPHTETLSPEYMTRISGTSVLGLAGLVSYRTRGFNHTDVFSFLRLTLNLFAYKTERFCRFYGPPLQESLRPISVNRTLSEKSHFCSRFLARSFRIGLWPFTLC